MKVCVVCGEEKPDCDFTSGNNTCITCQVIEGVKNAKKTYETLTGAV